MNHVQPIRDHDKISAMRACLARRSSRDLLLFVMGINTGLRISDLLKLTVADVRDRTHVTLTEQKTGKVKRFKLNETTKQAIAQYAEGLADDTYLFASRKTLRPISRVQAYRILNTCADYCGLSEIGTHTLRKTFGYHFYQRTKDVALLQELFGHSAPSITLKYIGINQDIMDAAMDDFSL